MTDKTFSLLHLLARLAALTGLVLAAVGLILWLGISDEAANETVRLVGKIVLIVGAVVIGLDLLFEFKAVLDAAASRRGAVGLNVVVQIALAIALLLGADYVAFYHHRRYDCTRERIFTIPVALRDQLSQLRGETRIVVYQRHTSFGQTGDAKQDNYDAAAERQIVEKVRDLADQFKQLGPRFQVDVLDIQDDNFEEKLDKIKKESKELAAAIEKAPENSIFFFVPGKPAKDGSEEIPGKVQRLSFHDIYQLDRVASRQANDNAGNLVLNDQGVGPFARKILNVEEKKPRVALAVVHELLSFTDPRQEILTMVAAGKVLRAAGFETRDLILKTKWGEGAAPEPTVLTFDASRFENLEGQRLESEATIKAITTEMEEAAADKKLWEMPLAELNQKLVIVVTQDGRGRLMERADMEKLKKSGTRFELVAIDEKLRRGQLQRMETDLAIGDLQLKREKADLEAVLKEQKTLNVEDLSEARRMTDLSAKMNRQLADCDLIILPRHTLLDVPRNEGIPSRAHSLDEAHFTAIKEFIRAGKPVLFCLGPTNESMRDFDPSSLTPDPLETALTDLGLQMPKQTILYNVEAKSFGERKAGLLIMGTKVDVPPVEFDWKLGAGLPPLFYTVDGHFIPESEHPIHISLELASRSVGKTPELDLRLRYPRPIYFKPGKVKLDPTLFMTVPESWNENQPFPTKERTPRFEMPKKDDPDNGTVKEKRRGPFPIAAAFEAEVPATWAKDKGNVKPVKTRLAVIGHGGVFVGKTLSVIQQKLLLDCCNWLLGRDDLLAHREETWQYPRVHMSDTEHLLWQWCTRLGMPLVFVYLGLSVWLIRRMR